MSTPAAPHDTMPALPMTALVIGVLLSLAGICASVRSWSLPWGLAGPVVGVLLILLGATGLGRTIAPGALRDGSGEETTVPAHLTGHLDPGLSRGLCLVTWLLALPQLFIVAALSGGAWQSTCTGARSVRRVMS